LAVALGKHHGSELPATVPHSFKVFHSCLLNYLHNFFDNFKIGCVIEEYARTCDRYLLGRA
jgi:hypothetical protein